MTSISSSRLPFAAAEREQPGASARDRARIGLAAGGVALLPLVDLLRHGWERTFGYLAADVFYYLTVARNLASGLGVSFDGEHATNGFHPLWQLYTALLYAASSRLGLGEPAFLVAVFASSLLLVALATALLGSCFRLALGRVPAAFPILPVGLYALGAASLEPRYGSLWSFANGMETGAALAAFAWALRCMVRRELRASAAIDWQLGTALAVLLLARLDHGALAICLLASYALRPARRGGSRFVELFAVAAPFGLALLAYLTFNWLTAGALLPVSGAVKSSFPRAALANGFYLHRILTQIEAARAGELWRMAQMLLPAMLAALALPWLAALRRHARHDALSWPLAVSALFALALAAYNFLFVSLWHQGHWYYPVSIALTSVLALYLWERERPIADGRAAALVAGASTAGALAFFCLVHHDIHYNKQYLRLFEARDEVKRHFEGSPPRMIEFDDGIISFATGFPAMSGLGFAVDRKAVPWVKSGQILRLAYQRGFDHIASLNYFGTGGLSVDSTSKEIRAKLDATFFLTPAATAPFEFEVVYIPSRVPLAFIRMRPATATAAIDPPPASATRLEVLQP